MWKQNRQILSVTSGQLRQEKDGFRCAFKQGYRDYGRLAFKHNWERDGDTYYGKHNINGIEFMTSYTHNRLSVYITFPTTDHDYVRSLVKHQICYLQTPIPAVTIVGWEYDEVDIEAIHAQAMKDVRNCIRRFFV